MGRYWNGDVATLAESVDDIAEALSVAAVALVDEEDKTTVAPVVSGMEVEMTPDWETVALWLVVTGTIGTTTLEDELAVEVETLTSPEVEAAVSDAKDALSVDFKVVAVEARPVADVWEADVDTMDEDPEEAATDV